MPLMPAQTPELQIWGIPATTHCLGSRVTHTPHATHNHRANAQRTFASWLARQPASRRVRNGKQTKQPSGIPPYALTPTTAQRFAFCCLIITLPGYLDSASSRPSRDLQVPSFFSLGVISASAEDRGTAHSHIRRESRTAVKSGRVTNTTQRAVGHVDGVIITNCHAPSGEGACDVGKCRGKGGKGD